MTAQPRTVLIAGNYGFGNAGDEAILAAMTGDLRRGVADLRVVVVSGNPEETRDAHGIEAVDWHDIPAVIEAVRSCDLIVLGGGGLFFDYWGVRPEHMLSMQHSDLAYWTEYALLSALLDKPLMIYAAGVGPLRTEASRAFTRLAFEQATVATVRDAASQALVASLGVPAERVQVAADPAFGLAIGDPAEGLRTLASLSASPPARPLLAVALRNWDIAVVQEDWERHVAAALDAFVETHGGTVAFTPFQSMRGALTDDVAVARSVTGRMRHAERAILVPGDAPVAIKAGVLAACDLVLGMRLHSVILAATHGVPAVAITYDPKVAGALAATGADEHAVDLSTLSAESLSAALERAYAQRSVLAGRLRERVAVLAEQARESARLAADLLGRAPGAPPKPLSPDMAGLLKSVSIAQARREHDLVQSVDALRRDGQRREAELATLRSALDAQRAESDAQLAERDRTAEALRQDIAERDRAAEQMGERLVQHERTIHVLEHSAAALTAQLLERERRIASLGDAIRAAEARHAEATQLANALAAQVASGEHVAQGLRNEVAERERAIQALLYELNLIKGTRGWALLERVRRLRALLRGGAT